MNEQRDTHISNVTLTDDVACKRLKPVRFEFLDYSTKAGRYVHLANELRLNRRLAGEVYRRVVPIWHDGSPCNGTDPPDDWLLEMTRLPDNATLAAALAQGRLTDADIDTVADTLAAFYRRTDRSPAIAANGDPAVLRVNVIENLDVLDAADDFGVDTAGRLRSRQLQSLERVSVEVRERMAAGWVRDAHGDLRAEHVYLLPDGPRILDCIAFNHRLRWIDIADDIAFLATDLTRLGGERFAARLVARYQQRLGDTISADLFAFFRSYRYAVRAKVAVLRGQAETSDRRAAILDDATELADRAAAELAACRPWLVIVGGLSGSGKSTLAAELARRIGAVHLASDRVRKTLHGLRPTDRGDESLYTAEVSQQTYAALLNQAETRLTAGTSVVVDATFLQAAQRDAAFLLGQRFGIRPLFVECRCDDNEAAWRLRNRATRDDDPSDASLAVRRRQQRDADGFAGVPAADHLPVETGQVGANPVAEIVRRLLSR